MMRKNKKNNLLIAKRKGKERGCTFCKTKGTLKWEDYESYSDFLSPRGRIIASQYSGVCAKHQRKLVKVIKQARHLALLPFVTQ
jgi:small subunit ribosomal protein S18